MTHQTLYDEIAKLPFEKLGKALSYIHFLEQEQEQELALDPAEEEELRTLISSGETVSAAEVYAKIKALPHD